MTDNIKTGISLTELTPLSDQWVEVVNGEIVEITMSAGLLHNLVIENLKDTLKPHVREHQLGVVLTDGLTYILEQDKNGVQLTRLPNVSFIRRGRILPTFDVTQPFPGAPDLAVEVTSPGQTVETLHERIHDYLHNGSDEVWVIVVATRELYQYHDLKHVTIYQHNEIFEPDVFAGLKISIAALFDISELYE